MKRVDLVKRLEKGGCKLLRHGAKHIIYFNPDKGLSQQCPVPREINERLAKKIIRDLLER